MTIVIFCDECKEQKSEEDVVPVVYHVCKDCLDKARAKPEPVKVSETK